MKSLKVKLSVSKLLVLMISFIYIVLSVDMNAQNVAITDDDGYTVDAAAMLDVKSVNKGFLVPRVALVSTTDPVSVTKPAGLLVWNTSTSGTYPDQGFYYWSGSDWVKVGSSALDFQNGLTQSGNSVKLGGTLTESSTITQGAYSLNFNLSGTGDFNIQDEGTSAFFVRDNGNVGIGTTSPGQKLEIAGNIKLGDNIMVEGNAGYRVYRNLASYSATGSAVNGAFVINTSQSMSSGCMIRLKIEGYMYDDYAPFEITIGAWCYNTTFSKLGFINTGSQKLDVRLAKNTSTGNLAIILGEMTDYSYPKLTVTEFMQGHSINETYADGWTITQETDLSGYDPVVNVPDVTNMDNRYYTETEVDNFFSGENLWDRSSGNLYPHTITDNVGIGTTTPGSRLEVFGNESGSDNDPLFEVKNNTGQTIFAVYPEGVRIYVDEDVTSKGLKGGFAVGGFNASKGITNEYLRITPDTFRIYVDDTGVKGLKGGFAVGGFGASKGLTNEYLRITPDSVRVYVDNEPGTKGLKGGFAVGGFSSSKGYEDAISFMDLTPENYFIGHESGTKTTPAAYTNDGKYNSFFGYQSGKENTVGSHNLFMGYQSGFKNIYGTNNVFLGVKAGYENEGIDGDAYKGCHNVFIGYLSGYLNTIGQSNVFVGKQSGFKNDSGRYNTYIGSNCGGQNDDGNFNTFIGAMAGELNTDGSNNVFIGYKAGGQNTIESSLLFIDNSNTIRPLIHGNFTLNHVVIDGNEDDNTAGRNFYVDGTAGGDFNWFADSDERLKRNIVTIPDALGKIQQLRGVNFEWKDPASLEKGLRMGFIAQEAAEIIPEVVDNTGEYYTMQYAPVTALLVEAVKEQQKMIGELKQENKKLINELQKINDLQQQIDRLRNSLDMNKQ